MKLRPADLEELFKVQSDLRSTRDTLASLPGGRDLNRIIEAVDRALAWVTATIARGELDTDPG